VIRTLIAVMAFMLGLSWAGSAAAQLTVQRSPAAVNPALGQVIRGTSDSTFSIATDGTVTRTSGNAIRLSSASVTPTTITVICQLDVLCNLRHVRVTVTITGSNGVAEISNLRISSPVGLVYAIAPASSGTTITFDAYPLGLNLGATFKLGMDVLVPSSGPTGYGAFTYTVTAVIL
jgi:hypothetical protein